MVIGRRGETLDSLQYLTILASNRTEESYCRISIDCNGYRDKRRETLESLAKRTSAKVIKQGRKIALATSKPGVYAKRILERYELLPYFDVVVGSELDGRRTDKGEVITEALRQLEIQEKQKPEVLMIGDRLHDMVGAGMNQIDKLGVYYGYAHHGELESAGADYIVYTVDELTAFFEAH